MTIEMLKLCLQTGQMTEIIETAAVVSAGHCMGTLLKRTFRELVDFMSDFIGRNHLVWLIVYLSGSLVVTEG